MRIACVHDWFVTYGGAERVVEQILNIYPAADLFALYDFIPGRQRDFIQNKPVKTSFLQKFPFARTKYRSYLPLMPIAIEQFDLSAYDLVITTTHAVAKGVITGPDQVHVAYVNSPIRYAWDLTHQYLHEAGLTRGPRSWLARMILHYIRMWDIRTSFGVDEFIGNSGFIARRIKKVYRRDAAVIYPPVDVDAFGVRTQKEDFYFTVSRMVPYKRIDLIVEAFSRMHDKKLVVIGDGPEFGKIRQKAGNNVTLLGFRPNDVVRDHLERAKAFVFAAEEDFGIVPLEAQACGTPVIAYGRGGALETVIDGKTGMFFDSQDVDSIIAAVEAFEERPDRFNPYDLRRQAERFSNERFREEFKTFVDKAIERHGKTRITGKSQRLMIRGKQEIIGEVSSTNH
ncbi:MAG: glycosyltransferase family 4 protein [candidate division Zixibacteria bacterium]|nr:glycosyltransferase family 4 protein [candidate division Zixibacteria bacterium]